MKRFIPFATLVLMAAVACDIGTSTDPNGGGQQAPEQLAADAALAQLTHAVAVAIADPTIKRQVAKDMAASPWRENKLVVPAYFETDGGQALAARVDQVLSGRLDDVLTHLPTLDFYLPIPTQREGWHGRATVMVAGVLDLDEGAIHAFAEGGMREGFSRGDPIPETPVLVLHPADPKLAKQPDGRPGPEGSPIVLLDQEDTQTELDYIYVSFDDGLLGGDVELSILTSFDDGYTVFATDSIYEELESNGGHTPDPWNVALFEERMPDSSFVHVHLIIIEEDLFDRDTMVVETVYWTANHDNVTVMDGANPVLTYRFGWTARDPQLVESVTIPTVNVDEGDYENAYISALDQYGYQIRFTDPENEDADVTNHFIVNTSIATAGSVSYGTGAATIPIYGVAEGWTQLVATVGLRTSSITDTTYVNVLSTGGCGLPHCPEGPVGGLE